MFDLFRRRDKVVKIFLGALLLLVALSMLTYLIPTYDTGTADASNQLVAQVGKEAISMLDVQKLVQNSLRARQLPPEILPNLIPEMVQDLITQRALAYEAQRLGIEVTDADVSETIRQTIPALFPQGNFAGKDAYAAMLAQQNLTIPEFEDDLRRQILINRLRNIATHGVIVSPAEIEQAYRKKNERARIQWVKLTSDKYKSEIQPSAADLQNYFNINKAAYQTREKKNLVILIADQGKLEQALTFSDADLRRYYEQNKDSFRTPESVDVRHILLKTTEKPASEEPKIKAQADDVLKQLKAGANFAELAKKYSEDPGSSQTGGEYKGVIRGQMVPEFEKAAFSMKPGEISDPVKTSIGYHIIQVEKHQDARLKPFEEVKNQIADQLKKQRASDMMQQIADRAQSELQKDPAHPERVAAEFNMQLVKADGVEAGKPIPEVGVSQDFDQAIGLLKKGEVSQPVALPNNKIALAVLTDVILPRPSTFEEVQDQIRTTVVANRTRGVLQKHAQELMDHTKSTGGDLEKAAKSMGLEVKTTEPVGVSSNIEGLGTASFLTNVIGHKEGFLFGPFPIQDGQMVGKLIQNVPVDLAQLAAQRDSIRDEIKTQKERDRASLFEAGLRDRLTKEGKLKVYPAVVNRLISDYISNNKG
ncbi:MAG: peptidylprolyl isomerase [Acidobacteriota bacterium]|nr:peptidylprolyl isomerase [Acidobacteriota bacterium]